MARLVETPTGVQLLDTQDRLIRSFGGVPYKAPIAGSAGLGFSVTQTDDPATLTTIVMLGAGTVVTPTNTGTVFAAGVGVIANGTTTDGFTYGLAYGQAASAPVAGAAATGTIANGELKVISSVVASELAQPCVDLTIVTGLTPGLPYWFDFQVAQITGGTITVQDLTVLAFEIG